ncbi:MAG: acetate kinase, partial [Clostridia bacterium]|nr:acetate kinase [Clostridia bacterium]
MNILICNAGSTSLKLKLFRMPEEEVVLTSRMDRIGGDKEGSFLFEDRNKKIEKKQMIASYEEGLTLFLKAAGEKIIKSVDAVGFKT